MVNVLCYLVILTHNGTYREEVLAKGVVVDDNYETWVVDFTKEIRFRNLDGQWNNYIQRIKGNSCKYAPSK